MKRLLTILAIVALLVVPFAATPGCAFFEQQRQTLEQMEPAQFEALKANVKGYGILAGSQLKGKLTAEQLVVAERVMKFIFEATPEKRAERLAQFIDVPEYRALVLPAISAALDLLEAAVGKPVQLESFGVTAREAALLEALLTGIIEGMK